MVATDHVADSHVVKANHVAVSGLGAADQVIHSQGDVPQGVADSHVGAPKHFTVCPVETDRIRAECQVELQTRVADSHAEVPPAPPLNDLAITARETKLYPRKMCKCSRRCGNKGHSNKGTGCAFVSSLLVSGPRSVMRYVPVSTHST